MSTEGQALAATLTASLHLAQPHDVALYAVPGKRLAAFTERVAALARANSVLTTFHQIRRRDVGAGKSPTIRESLAAMAPRG